LKVRGFMGLALLARTQVWVQEKYAAVEVPHAFAMYWCECLRMAHQPGAIA